MIPGFGKEQITIGSAPDNDVVLAGPGVAPHHARIVRQGGQLVFVDLGAGPTTANGAPVAPKQPVPFDFRTVFAVGGVPVPLSHPAICTMLMSPGQLQAPRGQVVVGRDAARASLVIAHAAVSGQHATVMLDRMMVVDHGSTSGTYVGGPAQSRRTSRSPHRSERRRRVRAGAVPVARPRAARAGAAGAGAGARAGRGPHARPQPARPARASGPPHRGAARRGRPAERGARKHRTVIGELNLEQLAGERHHDRPHARQRDRRPAPAGLARSTRRSSSQGGQLFLEDRGSAQRHLRARPARSRRGQRVPVAERREGLHRPDAAAHPDRGTAASTSSSRTRPTWAGKPLYEIEAWDLFLEVPDRDNKAQMKVLLDHVSFKALPGRHDRAHGPVGRRQDDAPARRSTATCRRRAARSASTARTSTPSTTPSAAVIGYVPQDDIVHPELTVFEAVKYSARFRLPPDYSEEEIDRRVDADAAATSASRA